jgi:hypothetical protein
MTGNKVFVYSRRHDIGGQFRELFMSIRLIINEADGIATYSPGKVLSLGINHTSIPIL